MLGFIKSVCGLSLLALGVAEVDRDRGNDQVVRPGSFTLRAEDSPLFARVAGPQDDVMFFRGSAAVADALFLSDSAPQGPQPPLPVFVSSENGTGRNCSTGVVGPNPCSTSDAAGTADVCSAKGNSGQPEGMGSACSSGGPAGAGFCSSDNAKPEKFCSAFGTRDNDCSTGGSQSGGGAQCSARGANGGNCSVYEGGGDPTMEHNVCSSFLLANAQCSTFGVLNWCSVIAGTPNAQCTSRFDGAWGQQPGFCSAVDGNGHCSVVYPGGGLKGPVNNQCDGDGIPD